MSNEGFGGLRVGNVAYIVTRIPGMTRPQLTRDEGNTLKPVAGFRDVEDAKEFVRWLLAIAEVANNGCS